MDCHCFMCPAVQENPLQESPEDRSYHVVITAQGAATHWQARVGHYWYLKVRKRFLQPTLCAFECQCRVCCTSRQNERVGRHVDTQSPVAGDAVCGLMCILCCLAAAQTVTLARLCTSTAASDGGVRISVLPAAVSVQGLLATPPLLQQQHSPLACVLP